jgi:hypothetical protein
MTRPSAMPSFGAGTASPYEHFDLDKSIARTAAWEFHRAPETRVEVLTARYIGSRSAMEVQEPVLKGLTSEFRFPALPRYSDRQGGIIERLRDNHGLSQWGIGDAAADAWAEDNRAFVHTSHQNVVASVEHWADVHAMRETVESLLRSVLEELQLEDFVFVGVRSYWLSAADSFEDLNRLLFERLGPANQDLFSPFGQPPVDSGWIFDFRLEDGLVHHLRLGPMKAEQAMAQFFRNKDTENYPPQFLFVDLDRVRTDEEGGLSFDDWLRAVERAPAVADDFHSALGIPT